MWLFTLSVSGSGVIQNKDMEWIGKKGNYMDLMNEKIICEKAVQWA